VEITEKKQGEFMVFFISGEVDMHNSPDLEKKLGEYTSKKTKGIIIDLSDATYLDSSGIATLVECYRKTREYEGTFYLAALHDKIRPIFEIMRLEKVFPIKDSVDDVLSEVDA